MAPVKPQTLETLLEPSHASMTAEWEAAKRLPPGERETALDIVAIKHGTVVRAALRDRTIAASSNVISLADRKSKLPKGL